MTNRIDTLRARADTTTFVELYDASSGTGALWDQMRGAMQGSDMWTIPNNDAFTVFAQSLGYTGTDAPGASAFLIANIDATLIATFLIHHSFPVGGTVDTLPATIETSRNRVDIAVDGTTLSDLDAESPDAEIVVADIATDTGLIHIIDNVLFYQGFGFNNRFVYPTVEPTGPTEGDDTLVGNMTSDRIDLLGGNDVYTALGGSDRVNGGAGNDNIDGECGNDQIWGDEGDDTILGGNGRDTLHGGLDNDFINGQNQEDVINGNDGNDTLIGDSGDDVIDGGTGDDDISGGKDNDVMTGGTGADIFRIAHNMGQDTITDFTGGDDLIDVTKLDVWDISQLDITQDGADVKILFKDGQFLVLSNTLVEDLTNADFILDAAPDMTPTEGSDRVTGTSDADAFIMLGGSDQVTAGAGDDTVDGGSGKDTIDGGDGHDHLTGGTGADNISGGLGRDTIFGGGNNDRIKAGSGDDWVNGGSKNDRIYGDGGNDTLYGGNGNDRIWGGNKNDEIYGGKGHDTIYGGNGEDIINGGKGDDALSGDADADVFVFDKQMRNDTVTDFTDGEDTLDVTAWGISDISELNFVQQGADVFVEFSDRDSLLLQNVDLADLDNSDLLLAQSTRPTERDDVITGTNAADSIDALGGNDVVSGGRGKDTIDGGAGDDTLTGGSGEDTFVFNALSGQDTVTDYDINKDTLEINDTLFLSIAVLDDYVSLTHSGGTVILEGVEIDTLADYNAMLDSFDTTFVV